MTDAGASTAHLSADRRALLARLRGTAEAAAPLRALPGTVPADRPPLSVAQEQLWFLDQLAPGQPTYNVGQATLITGPLDRAALSAALDDLVARHAALRTTFAVHEGRPYQVVAEHGSGAPAISDLTGLPEAEREAAARRHVRDDDVGRPFDLARGPLFRTRLYVLGDDRHVLALTVHHSVADGWSLGVLNRELGTIYAARRAGRDAGLPEVTLQQPDYCAWQRRQTDSGAFERQLDYWEKRLDGLPVLPVPADRPRPGEATYRGEIITTRLDAAARDAMRALARGSDATDFMVLGTVFNALLSRYTQTDDIVIGSTVSGRSRPEFADLVGFLVNMVVLRTDTSGDPAFSELLGRVRDTCLGAWSAQDVPFEQVVDRLRPPRNPSRNPLFQVSMQLLGGATAGGRLELEGTVTRPVPLGFDRARFDMSVSVVDDGTELTMDCEYSTDLFDRARITRMFGHFTHMLLAAAADPSLRVSELPMLSERERADLLTHWQGPSEEGDHRPVPDRIAAIAAARGDRIAVRSGAAEVTYAELMRRVDALAAWLRARGVGREDIVAIALHRGIDVVVAVVGVLRAGAAFLVVDPDHPKRRLEFILGDAEARIVLTHTRFLDRLPEGDGRPTLCMDAEQEPVADAPPADPISEDDLAYVLYTSGSTGEPKGVAVEHHALNTFVDWMSGVLEPEDRVLQHMSLIFDLAEGEMLSALSRGCTLVVLPEERRGDPLAYAELMTAERITFLAGPPAILNRIPPGDYPDMRYVMPGGETVPPELADRWSRSSARFVNTYGPTEAAVACTSYPCEPRSWTTPPPIGRAMPNRYVYVLDRHDRPMPVGVPGEIVVGGDGVGRGYLNRTELTSSRFVADPFRPGGRMYRTGDLGVWTEEGQIQFLTRIDTQVKLNGLRIELGEIEAALKHHPAVAGVVAHLRTDPPHGPRLVGYVVPVDAGDVPGDDELRRHLLDEIPTYMVPTAFVTLDEVPLTRVGKVDRDRLPAPNQQATARVEPRTEVERRVAELFAEVLEVEPPGVRTGFFELGGNSLQTIQLLARIGEELGGTLSLRDFYADPTVEAAARMVASGERPGEATTLVTLRPGDGTPLYLVPAVSGSPYWYSSLAQRLGADSREVRGFIGPGLDDDATPPEDIARLADHYLAALRAERASGPYLLAGWSMGGVVAYEMAQRLTADGADVGLVAVLDSAILGPVTPPADAEILRLFVEDLAGLAGRATPPLDDVPAEPAADRAAALTKLLVDGGLLPPGATERFVERRYAVFLANVRALHTYEPASYPGRLLVVRAAQSPDITRWRMLTPRLTETVVPGDHYSMWSEPGLGELTRTLDGAIRDAT